MSLDPTQKQNIAKNIGNSVVLSPAQKDAFNNILEVLSTSQINELENILAKELAITGEVDEKYKLQEVIIQNEYLQALKEFSQTTLKKSLKEWENKETQKEMGHTDSLLNDLPEVKTAVQSNDIPEGNSAYVVKILLAALVILSLIIFVSTR